MRLTSELLVDFISHLLKIFKTYKMKKQLFLMGMFFCLIGIEIKGQKDSLLKNELGLNLIPAVRVLSGDDSGIRRKNALYFKRKISRHFFYRASLMIVVTRNNSLNDPFKYAVVGENDSSLFVRYYQRQTGNELRLFQGIEFRWGKRQLNQFGGVDLFAFQSKDHHVDKFSEWNESNIHTSSNGTSYFMPYSESFFQADSVIADYTIHHKGFGVNPFYGVMFELHRRFYLSAQLGVNLTFSYNETKYEIDNYQYTRYGPFLNLDFTTEGILNNFSLFYRF
jgi:hypothetical protein